MDIKNFKDDNWATVLKPVKRLMAILPLAVVAMSSGCTALISPIQTIPASRVPPELLAVPTANDRVIEFPRLRQVEPEEYILDTDDVLGIFVEGLFAGDDPSAPTQPPVTFPEPGSDLAPAIGLPYPVREDGTVTLPYLGAVSVRGLTLEQAEDLIGRMYAEKELFTGSAPIVTLMKKRTYKVFVIRQDNQFGQQNAAAAQLTRQAVSARSDYSSRGFILQLPAYRNDLLNALTETGGMPGVNAKSEVKILRGGQSNFKEREQQLREFYQQYGTSNIGGMLPDLPEDENVLSIPLRLKPGEFPKFTEDDIIMRDGDVVLVETRDSEVYYTGGLLNPGEFLLPRDKDTDVLNAVALAGTSVGAISNRSGGGFAAGLGGGIGSVPPTQLIVLRPLPGNRQIAIEVDLTRAVNDPRERLLVKAGDTLILRHKPREELLNFSLGTFFTFGIRQLFR